MGNCLVIASTVERRREAEVLFRSGLEVSQRLNMRGLSGTVDTGFVRAASFARWNGFGSPIITDPQTGSWLLALGTWFHTADYGVGAEGALLERYLAVGAMQLGKELDGFFVIVIGDTHRQETIVLTDIVGSCHCYVRAWQHMVALSGSSLLLAGLGDITLDPIGCQEFLATGILYEDRTFYQEVRKLDPATVFTFAGGVLKAKQRYWQISDLAPESLDGPAAVQRLGESLIQAAQRIGKRYPRPVCDLTGGYDSRAVVASFLSAGVPCSTTVSGPVGSPDVVVAHELATMAGLSHRHITPQRPILWEDVTQAVQLTDGEYDVVDYARILQVHRTLADHFEISINGSFGEVARGYWWELLWPRAGACRELDAQKVARLRYAAQPFDASLWSPEQRLDLVEHFVGVIRRTNTGLTHMPNTLQMDNAYLMMRMQRWQGRIASSTNRVWPCLSLFLSRSVLETMLQTKTHLRRRSLLIRHMLATFQPQLAAFPLEHGYPALPVTWRNFYRFWPIFEQFGEKVARKVRVRLRLPGGLPPQLAPLPIRLQLWKEEEVREILQAVVEGKMRALVHAQAVGDFLARSQQPQFPFGEQWGRVLSLASTLTLLEQIQPRSRSTR